MAERCRAARARDEGTIGILSLGLAVLAIMIILVVSAATGVHMQNIRLTNLADELALDAADALDLDEYYASAAPTPTDEAAVRLAEARMREAVLSHLDKAAERLRLSDVRLVSVEAIDRHTARVTVAVVVQPMFGLDALLPYANGIELVATGTARSF